jgi:glycosyltransferase involved in cell wall biosynthesis
MPWDSLAMYNPVTPTLYAAVADGRWDFVDAHSHLFWTTAIAVAASLKSGKPSITTVHGLIAQRDQLTNISQRAYLMSVGTWLLKNSSRVVCLTKSDANEVANLGVKRSNVKVIPTAVDPSQYKKRPARIDVLWVGRMVAEKNLGTLVEALSLLSKKRRLKALLVGDGPLRDKVMAAVRRLNLSNVITFKPRADRAEVAEFLSEAKVFALPSLKEGLPLAMLEAMASAATVVASDIPSIRSVLGDSGLYSNPLDPIGFAGRLEEALDSQPVRIEKGRLARRIVEEHYSWAAILPRLEELYSEVLRE